ncbi:MAG TPA: hypothetical protein VKB75_11505, partial [Jatrophihabitans sp.]|nr:hypothetical protein [Jatrophihabitans sp.]
MLIRPAELAAMREGTVDLAFRRWDRPRLRVGTHMRTQVGLLEVLSVRQVAARSITAGEARRAGAASRAELLALLSSRADRPIFRVELRYAGADPRVALRAQAAPTPAELDAVRTRLARLDAASRRGPWTKQVLQLIAARPAVRAPDLAAELGLETAVFKRDVRKLKELGLTESLKIGYRLAPRGHALLT